MKLGNEVGYSIRFEDCTTDRTIIKCDRSPPSGRVLAAYAGSATCRSMRTADGTISECLALAQSPGRRRSRSRRRLSRAKRFGPPCRGKRATACAALGRRFVRGRLSFRPVSGSIDQRSSARKVGGRHACVVQPHAGML